MSKQPSADALAREIVATEAAIQKLMATHGEVIRHYLSLVNDVSALTSQHSKALILENPIPNTNG